MTPKQIQELRAAAHELRAAVASNCKVRTIMNEDKDPAAVRILDAWNELDTQLERTR